MRVLTWNVNGIRASRVVLKDLLDSLDADIICIQETKVTRDQLDASVATVDGYNSYFSFSRKRSGYSGVATFCKNSVTPWRAEEGLSGVLHLNKDVTIGCYGNLRHFTDDELESLDAEGRTIITQHKIRATDGKEKNLVLINVYCPRADAEREDRKLYKLQFYALLQTRAEALLESGSHVIILGDINSSHKQIDQCNPDDEEFQRVRPGRLWMNQLLWEPGRDPTLTANEDELKTMPGTTPSVHGGRFIDTFRYFHPDQKDAFTNWCTLTGARQTNYGRRLDYIFADVDLTANFVTDTIIMPEVEGSDHCPVRADLTCQIVPSQKCPPLCTKYMPEFSGKQQRLSDIFSKVTPNSQPQIACSSKTALDMKLLCCESASAFHPTLKYEKKSRASSCGDAKPDSLKRSLAPENSSSEARKKSKVKKSPSTQQSNLMKFFGKPKSSLNTNLSSGDKINKSVNGNSDDLPSSQESSSSSADISDVTMSVKSAVHETEESQGKKQLSTVKSSAALAWKTLLSGPGKAPLCKGHKEPCVLRTVKKDGPNKGKQFYVCARGEGHSSNPEARCDFFKWVERKKLS